MPVFIIAEAGVNHDGSLEKALQLIDVAAAAGADAVKFQTFQADEIIAKGTPKADYQVRQTGDGDQYEMIAALELDEAAHRAMVQRCTEKGIEFMSTPFGEWATELLLGLGMRRIKIASGELTNKPLVEDLARRNLPIILSTGMATLDEVGRAVGWISNIWTDTGACHVARDLTVLHCTSDYPAKPADLNLRAIRTIADHLSVPVGYSDHSLGIAASIAAVAMGATVIEKHFTLNPSDPGPDHAASLDPDELGQLVRSIRLVETGMGDGRKVPSAAELRTRELVRRSAYARREIAQGQVIQADDIVFRRPSGGIGPERVDELVGRIAERPIRTDSRIEEADLQSLCGA